LNTCPREHNQRGSMIVREKEGEREKAHDIRSSITVGKRSSRLRGLDLELGNDNDDSNVLRETVTNVSTDVFGRLRRFCLSRSRRTSVRRVGREDFSERNR